MSEDPGSGASGTAEPQASALLGSAVREGYADIGDVRLHYVEAGEGPLVVLLHGFPEFWYGWLQIDGSQGLHHPGQLRKSWYFFFFDLPDLPESVVHANRWHFFRHFLHDARPAYTPEEIDRYIEAWSQARRGNRDDQLLPVLGTDLA